MLCPSCENKSDNTQQCTNCGWKFVYFTQKPTELEKNEYTILLQNYRTELYFNLAQQYYQNKQYEETIKYCFISCEHNMFENPLALLALTYQKLKNDDIALKDATMALNINPNNEMPKQILVELDTQIERQNVIVKLIPEMLEKNMFETTEEHADRIENLGYVEIGTVQLEGYDADNQKLQFRAAMCINLATKIPFISTNDIYKISLSSGNAKELFGKERVPLLVKLKVININKNEYIDMKIDNYSFIREFLKYQQSKHEKLKEKQKREEVQKQIIETEKEPKNNCNKSK